MTPAGSRIRAVPNDRLLLPGPGNAGIWCCSKLYRSVDVGLPCGGKDNCHGYLRQARGRSRLQPGGSGGVRWKIRNDTATLPRYIACAHCGVLDIGCNVHEKTGTRELRTVIPETVQFAALLDFSSAS